MLVEINLLKLVNIGSIKLIVALVESLSFY